MQTTVASITLILSELKVSTKWNFLPLSSEARKRLKNIKKNYRRHLLSSSLKLFHFDLEESIKG